MDRRDNRVQILGRAHGIPVIHAEIQNHKIGAAFGMVTHVVSKIKALDFGGGIVKGIRVLPDALRQQKVRRTPAAEPLALHFVRIGLRSQPFHTGNPLRQCLRQACGDSRAGVDSTVPDEKPLLSRQRFLRRHRYGNLLCIQKLNADRHRAIQRHIQRVSARSLRAQRKDSVLHGDRQPLALHGKETAVIAPRDDLRSDQAHGLARKQRQLLGEVHPLRARDGDMLRQKELASRVPDLPVRKQKHRKFVSLGYLSPADAKEFLTRRVACQHI